MSAVWAEYGKWIKSVPFAEYSNIFGVSLKTYTLEFSISRMFLSC